MTFLVILDTNAVIEFMLNNEKIVNAVRNSEEGTVFITSITRYELLKHSSQDKRRSSMDIIEKLGLHPFDKKASDLAAYVYLRLRARGEMINENDILIAGIALAAKDTLITTDKGFEKVDGLGALIVEPIKRKS